MFTADNYMFKVDNINTRKSCEICSGLTIKTPEDLHFLQLPHISFKHLQKYNFMATCKPLRVNKNV